MRCSKGRRYLTHMMDPTALEQQLDASISDIRDTFLVNCVPLFSCSPYFLNALGSIRFCVSNRIVQVDRRIWHLNFPPSLHGRYADGKIFLNQGNWCRKTLYHEALHGVSIFMVPSTYGQITRAYPFLSEGLTEVLTGYILLKKHPECYAAWKNGTFAECKISYRNQVKLWCAFCNFINLKEITRLYFWEGVTDWNTRYGYFLTAIHDAGYPRFRDVFALPGDKEMLFTQECLDNFGGCFRQILNSRKSLELGLMRAENARRIG